MITVLIADDHQIVTDGLKVLLEDVEGITCKGVATNGREVLEFLASTPVDIVLLDIDMPLMDGIECCKKVRERYAQTQVIALTMHSERGLIRKMLESGALGYLLKNAGKNEVVRAIQQVAQKKSYYSDEVASTIVRGSGGSASEDQIFPSLSRREKEIVGMIVNEMTTGEIAASLHISFNTVETHRRNIMHKLGAKNTAGIVRMALEYKLLD